MKPTGRPAPPPRAIVLGAFVGAGIALIALLTLVLPDPIALILLDRRPADASSTLPYPFTIQNLTHLLLFAGLGELFVRWRVAQQEHALIAAQMLPEDSTTVLQAHNLGPIRESVAGRHDEGNGFLPSLIELSILQFFSSRSVDQTVSVMNSKLELMAHRVELRYTMLRYVSWLIPTIGFIGTVVGISATLAQAGASAEPELRDLATTLSVSFNTTMVALLESALLVLFMNIVESREEAALSRSGDYCLRNLINRLYEQP